MGHMFFNCSSLVYIPDISKWNTNNVTDIFEMFEGCTSLSSFPDISKWNINKIKNINVSDMFSSSFLKEEFSNFNNFSNKNNLNKINNSLDSEKYSEENNNNNKNLFNYNEKENGEFEKQTKELNDYYNNFYN